MEKEPGLDIDALIEDRDNLACACVAALRVLRDLRLGEDAGARIESTVELLRAALYMSLRDGGNDA